MKKTLSFVLALAMVSMLGVFPAMASAADNLVANGDFEAGNTGFSSDFRYVVENPSAQSELWDPFTYGVGLDPKLYHSSWTSYFDHTKADGTGNMMIVNASSGDATKLVWGENITLPACNQVTEYKLYAGQTWEIGKVLVKTEADKVCVKFVLTDAAAIADGWQITEAHVAVAATCTAIPQVKGNPTPGQFPISVKIAPGVTETEWYCLDYAWTVGTPLCIAAHAKLEHAQVGHTVSHEYCVTSGTGTQLVGGGTAALSPAWVNGWEWPVSGTFVGNPDWIWDPATMNDAAAGTGSRADFANAFTIVGTPTGDATLKVQADNAFQWSVNGGAKTAYNLASGWESAGNFLPGSVVLNPMMNSGDSHNGTTYSGPGWSQFYTIPVSSLHAGSNTLNVTAVNATWDVADWDVNPGGVIYELCGTSEEYVVDEPYASATGWGDGQKFPGKNWATCITYTPQACSNDYRFSFWAANSYPTNTATLNVSVNGVSIGVAPLAEITDPITGQWKYYEFGWSADSATAANIEIKDMRSLYDGDDYALDDISFVKLP